MTMIQADLFNNLKNDQDNPLIDRRIGFIGKFKNRKALVDKVIELGASKKSKAGLTRDCQILVIGSDVKQEELNRQICYEHDGWKPFKISEKQLLEIINGNYAGYERLPKLQKNISIDMSYYYWNPPIYNENDEDYTGIRCSSPLVYDGNNPIYGKEIYVPNSSSKISATLQQLIGNFGGFANSKYFDDTNIVLLSKETFTLLKQGIKDKIIMEIEKEYNENNFMMFNIQFTCEMEFIAWVEMKMKQFPDESTIKLLKEYYSQAEQTKIYPPTKENN